MRSTTRLLALPLIAGLSIGLGSSPAAADTTSEATAAASWLAAQTGPAGVLSSFGGRPDYSLTIDAVLGGIAAGAPQGTIDGWLTAIEKVKDPEGRTFADLVTIDPNKPRYDLAAKTLVAATAAGRSPEFAGLDLKQMTQESMGEDGHAQGANAFGQAFAMLGLARTSEVPAESVSFLADQQCADGGFPMYFSTDPEQHCDVSTKNPDPDGTAMLIMALRGAEAEGLEAAAAPMRKAVTWLKDQQLEDGSFEGAKPYTASPNTNTTGLAAAALSGLEPATVAKAGGWVSTLQLKKGDDAGAIAYRLEDLNQYWTNVSENAGLPVDEQSDPMSRGTWTRATTQAVLALAPVDFYRLKVNTATPPTVPTPDKYIRTAPYTLAGNHTVNGRQWKTVCQEYSQTERCRTDIWATTVVRENGHFVRKNAWVFNNLTYLPYMTEAAWQGNPLAEHNMKGFTSGGRQWRTECHTAQTGRGACRSYTLSTVYSAQATTSGYVFRQYDSWVFNNIVMFGGPEKR